MISWKFLETELNSLLMAGLLRYPEDGSIRDACGQAAMARGVVPIDASSNDYLGYAQSSVSRETYRIEAAAGAGASRLIHGTRPVHRILETALSDWVDQPATLLFSSGYAANLGVMVAMGQSGDLIISDALNHASIIDGCRLSKAEVVVFRHADVREVETILREESSKRRCWVVTESYFSMDGDSPDLRALRLICDEFQAGLVVDEAHALGIFGPRGSGLCHQSGVKPDIMIGTFGKALGAQGAFVASSTVFRSWLWNRARSFVYSTALSPMLAAIVHENLIRVQQDESGRTRLETVCSELRRLLADAGVSVRSSSYGPIIPIMLGPSEKALAVANNLLSRGILVQAIRPPTVAPDSCRIRLTVNSTLSEQHVEMLAESIIRACAE